MTYPFSVAAAVAALLVLPVSAAAETAPVPSPGEIAAAAPAGDWVVIPASDLLVMTLAPDAKGRARRVVIQLMPAPFSQGWIGNIRKLAAAHWWDGVGVYRVQDNYVAQWGDATDAKALPDGLMTVREDAYSRKLESKAFRTTLRGGEEDANPESRDAYLETRWSQGGDFRGGPMVGKDSYAPFALFWRGWPLALQSDAKAGELFATTNSIWPVHCYGAVGVARNLSPDTGTGAELYAVIGHAPRQLDRNIAVVGRVIEGIEHLSSLPRGTGALGFYEDAAERVPILSVRIASDLPAADRPVLEYLSTESDSFARYAEARANRRDPFFIAPAGGADICNIPVPVRPVAAE